MVSCKQSNLLVDRNNSIPFFLLYRRQPFLPPFCLEKQAIKDSKEYDEIICFLESKDSEQRNCPRDVLESKDVKDAKRAYRQKCEGFITDAVMGRIKQRIQRGVGAGGDVAPPASARGYGGAL